MAIRDRASQVKSFAKTDSRAANSSDLPVASSLFVGSVEKGLRVLQAFRSAQHDLSLSEISKLTGLDKSACQRFTNTLYTLGYLEKLPHNRHYRPGKRLLDFSFAYLLNNRLAQIATARLIEASRAYDTTVNLCELLDTDVIYTIRTPHEKIHYKATLIGARTPAFCAAGGICILAFRSEREAAAIVDASERRPLTGRTITERKVVLERIARARERGYDIGFGQALPNEISVAAPVLDQNGRGFAAVQIPVYPPHWSIKLAREKLAPLVMETARSISGTLGSS